MGDASVGAGWALSATGGLRRQEVNEQIAQVRTPATFRQADTGRGVQPIGVRQRRAESLGRDGGLVVDESPSDVNGIAEAQVGAPAYDETVVAVGLESVRGRVTFANVMSTRL